MKQKLPLIFASILGLLHFLIVGVPFIIAGGGGEGIIYIILIDLPLYIIGELVFRGLLLNSVIFNFILFVVVGTLMYALLGYLLGALLHRIKSKN
jgi:hypothetical protein